MYSVTFATVISRTFLLILFILTVQSYGQPIEPEIQSMDYEQYQLEIRYTYSNLFGYNIDTIQHPQLFEMVGGWLGTSYRYGGDTKKGIDCSGFVSQLYKNVFCIELDENSAGIFKKVKPVKNTDLNEGDLVFFKIRKKRISHVGIYLGQNKFAHASVKQGVTINDLADPYFKKYFYMGGRMDTELSFSGSERK